MRERNGILTASIKSKIRPAIIEIGLLGPNPYGLDLAHLARSGAQVLEIGHELDQAADEGGCEFLGEALVLAVAECADCLGFARGVEFCRISHLRGIACCLPLCNVTVLVRK